MSKTNDIQFIDAAVTRLDEYAGSIDEDALSRLNAARTSALAIRQQELSIQQQQLNKMRDVLVQSEELPSDVEIQLSKIRAQALARTNSPRLALPAVVSVLYDRLHSSLFGVGWRVSHGMVATACLSIALVSIFYGANEPRDGDSSADDMVMIASSEELELYENLDFYLWLADNELLN